MNQLSPVLKALVLGQKGPLQQGEIERTKDYARDLAVKLKEEKVWTLPENKEKALSRSKELISSPSNALREAESAFSVFFSGLFLSAVSYAALNPQLSFLFLTKTHHLIRQ
jgi:hypothetical protein